MHTEKKKDIACIEFRSNDNKTCIHYRAKGHCALSGRNRCSEWLKVNGMPSQKEKDYNKHLTQEAQRGDADQSQRETDLYGDPLPLPKPERKSRRYSHTSKRHLSTTKPADNIKLLPPPPGMTKENIESFKALRAEVCIKSKSCGDIWLVPEYTQQQRKELIPEHFATLWHIADIFPGAKIISFEKQVESKIKKGDGQ